MPIKPVIIDPRRPKEKYPDRGVTVRPPYAPPLTMIEPVTKYTIAGIDICKYWPYAAIVGGLWVGKRLFFK